MKHLKIIRLYYNFTQEQMSILLDISAAHYSRIERGDDRRASCKLILKTSKVFAANPCLLFCEELKGRFVECDSHCMIGKDVISIEDIPNIFTYSEIEDEVEKHMNKAPRRSDLLKIIHEKKKDKE